MTSSHSKFCLFATDPLPDSVLDIDHMSKAELCDSINKQMSKFGNMNVAIDSGEARLKEVFKLYKYPIFILKNWCHLDWRSICMGERYCKPIRGHII